MNKKNLKDIIVQFNIASIKTSLFIDPVKEQIEASSEIGACWVEFHTGSYANSKWEEQAKELAKLKESVKHGRTCGLHINAGHGLTYQNVEQIASIQGIEELNIGHTIISRALAVGLKKAVKEMKELIQNPRQEPLFGA